MTDDTDYTEDAIRDRLPDATGEKYADALVAAIRNPDATPTELSDLSGIESPTVEHALTSAAMGTLDEDNKDGPGTAADRRGGNNRVAETYAELTDKQAAVIDFFARNPDVHENFQTGDGSGYTDREIAEAINESDRYDATVSESYPSMVLTGYNKNETGYGHLVDDRRSQLMVDGDLDPDGSVESTIDPADARDCLDRAGFNTPDDNLDLDAADDSEPEPDPERPDGPWSWDRFGDFTWEYAIVDDTATKGDIVEGVRYMATVTGKQEDGLHIALGHVDISTGRATPRGGGQVKKAMMTAEQKRKHVQGFIHQAGIRVHDRDVPDFEPGDTIGVMLFKRKAGSGDLQFEMTAAIDTLRNFQFEKMPDSAPVHSHTQGAEYDDGKGREPSEPDEPVEVSEPDTTDSPDEEPEPVTPEYDPEHFDPPTSRPELYELLDDLAAQIAAVDDAAGGAQADDIDVRELHARIDEVDEHLNSTRGWLSNADEKAEDALNATDGLGDRVTALADDVETLHGQVDENTEGLSRVTQRLEDVETAAGERERATADGRGLPGEFGYAERMLHDLSDDWPRADVALKSDEDGYPRLVVTARGAADE